MNLLLACASMRMSLDSSAPPNKPLQRSGMDKVPSRGRGDESA
jgi:hypothetical protein